jgi:hypothetical protein
MHLLGFLLVIGLQLVMMEGMSAQEPDSLKQQINNFLAEHQESHEKKYLNLSPRELGSIEDEPYLWKDYFKLESREKFENQLGYKKERKIYFSFYAYETELDRQYALKYWLEDFIEGESVRPGRDVRSYEYATPTIILINPQSIVICNYDCKYYDEENFEYWKNSLKKLFGQPDTRIIEIECDGPLKWTDNAPDPKVRGLF